MSSETVDRIIDTCVAAGLDLHAMANVGAYNASLDVSYHLPGDDEALVIVIGNTRALWPHLGEYVRSLDAPPTDPVDGYVEQVIGAAVANVAELVDVRFSHEPPPRLVAIQRLADLAGLAWLSSSHLCIHPTFGPWIALRAAIVLDLPGIAAAPASPAACDCAVGCGPLLEAAIASGERVDTENVRNQWRHWVAMRDGCPVGREHRYSDEQIEYHYIGTRPAQWSCPPEPRISSCR
jgi:cyanocobalamin reductase (cyanide-eliminating) / alkylcobalamin dealkylase